MSKTNTSLSNLDRSISQLDQVSAMQAALRQSAFDEIKPDDIKKIIKKQIDKALAGDDKAASFVMKFAVGLGGTTNIRQTNVLCTDVATAAKIGRSRG